MGLDPKLRARIRERLDSKPTVREITMIRLMPETKEKIREIAVRHDTTMQRVVELAVELLDDLDRSR